jgi:anthranilate synthase/aminodeoxychorismate synthase-like glutamine amidotransferase
MVLLIDNYDSFTYNLVQYLGELGAAVQVRRNDAIQASDLDELRPSHVVISPGPGRPEHAGVSVEVIRRYGPRLPILGVCLGHQAIGIACGGQVVRALKPLHGKTSPIEHDGLGVFRGLTSTFQAARYHSLVIAPGSLPAALVVSAHVAGEETIMGVRHCDWPLHGVQFHPESIMTSEGRRILRNFLEL